MFDRVFAGAGSTGDLGSLVRDFNCEVIVLIPQDGAWSRDPFAASPLFTRVDEVDGKWWIYRATIDTTASKESARYSISIEQLYRSCKFPVEVDAVESCEY